MGRARAAEERDLGEGCGERKGLASLHANLMMKQKRKISGLLLDG